MKPRQRDLRRFFYWMAEWYDFTRRGRYHSAEDAFVVASMSDHFQ